MTARGVVRVPGDKSISHRALILGSLATGVSRINGILESADVQSTASVLRNLGATIPDLSPNLLLRGRGKRSLTPSVAPLYAGNSGTTVRLMAGVVSAHEFVSRFEGDASLSRRPMQRIAEPLTAMGARFEFARGDGLPMTIHGGALSGVVWNTRAASAQTKSAILLAGLVSGVHVSVRESQKSRDHTERMLISMGARVETDESGVTLSPVESLTALDLDVPGDPSSAAYLVALGVLRRAGFVILPSVCVNPTRTGFMQKLVSMGAYIVFEDSGYVAGDTAATVIAHPSKLADTTVEASEIPAMIDELPLLGCVAAAAGVTLEVRGAGELRSKESDRIAALVSNLNSVGARAEELPDGFRILRGSRTLSGLVRTHADHRIAMAFGILGALPGNSIAIDDKRCVDISYPGFWTDLERLSR
ncbi:MAG TPA: 3-phosphoshikimate 1-carboxyvinyltransferase [Gemmatimonadaceae bacterium]|nr:3-phosphoshikimate 1-carboxyvinyltransferase [Gemmatimonadaceae bacterium]